MAGLTVRTTSVNGEAIETLYGSDGSVTQRVLEAQGRRVEKQIESNQQEPLVVWDGDGRVKPVGANSSYRPRGVQANSGLGQGDPVQLNGGLVSATPSAGNLTEAQSALREQGSRLEKLAKSLAGQFGSGDPNNETTSGLKDALPRYPNDTYYDLDSGTLFRWEDDSANSHADPKWLPLYQVFQGSFSAPDSGNPDALAATVYVDGAIAINADGQIYLGETTTPGWSLLAGGSVLSLTTDPTTAGTPVQDNLLVIDKTNGDQWYADNSDPQVWAKQPSGGGIDLKYYFVGVSTTQYSSGTPGKMIFDIAYVEDSPGGVSRSGGDITIADTGIYRITYLIESTIFNASVETFQLLYLGNYMTNYHFLIGNESHACSGSVIDYIDSTDTVISFLGQNATNTYTPGGSQIVLAIERLGDL